MPAVPGKLDAVMMPIREPAASRRAPPLGLRSTDSGRPAPESITETGDWAVYDALADPELGRVLLRWVDATGELEGEDGRFTFHLVNGRLDLPVDAPVRPMGVEQSNSSLVLGDQLVAKLFRKLEPGLNPELEMLRFLAAHGFENIAPLYGWAEYEGDSLAATLAVVATTSPIESSEIGRAFACRSRSDEKKAAA